MTDGIYIPDNSDEPLGRIEDALPKVIAAEKIEKKIQRAVKSGTVKRGSREDELEEALKTAVINENEAELVKAAIAIRKEVIRVDDFPKDKWRRN